MAFDEGLADRIREELAGESGVAEKRMFGGLAFLVGGHMAVSASGQGGLLVRCRPDETATLAAAPHVQRFEMRGRTMDGWLHVADAGVASDDELSRWVRIGLDYVRSVPPK